MIGGRIRTGSRAPRINFAWICMRLIHMGIFALSRIGLILIQRHVVRNAFRVSLVVGALLNAINQGPALTTGQEIDWLKVLLNFVVPYCVASYSAARNQIEWMSRNESEN
ncbi:nitrate/nitrite transporter NrtS [Microbulbifer thermotolerans]|nr:nitrate/nitrite transporter NrtS [Microbulbifer thermotolerans]